MDGRGVEVDEVECESDELVDVELSVDPIKITSSPWLLHKQ